MSVINVGNHLPSLIDKLPLRDSLHAAKRIGHEVVKTAMTAREVSKLEFNGRHALRGEDPSGRTTHELGATTLHLPFAKGVSHTPHTPDKPKAKSVAEIQEGIEAAKLQEIPGLDPDYMYTQPNIIPKKTSR